MDLSHLENEASLASFALTEALPAAWDWRSYNGTTPVKDQGSCPTCWVFAGTSALESSVLVHSGIAYDLAEENVKECNDSMRGCYGGTDFKAASHFTNHGAVLEACNPYNDETVGLCNSSCPRIIQATGWRLVGTKDIQAIKSAIYQYGPCYTSVFASWPEFLNYDGSYVLYYGGNEGPDHAVVIVGWDDNLTHAGGKGAWICKNSWGTAWGENGFFYIAYGSAKIGAVTSYYSSFKDFDPHENLYLYDEGGWNDSYGYPESATAWGLARFMAGRDESIQAVDFWVNVFRLDYTIYIYDNFDGNNVSGLLHSQSGTIASGGGYFSIPLSSPVYVSRGDDFAVVVRFSTTGYAYPVPTDYINTYYPIESGKCFISPDGSPGSWTDLGVTYNRDIGIRVRAENVGEEPPAPPTDLVAATAACDQIHLSWSDNSNTEAGFKIERSENGVDFGQVRTTSANAIAYTDTGLAENKTYWYQVAAFNSGGDSYSNIASGSTPSCSRPPFPPSNLLVTALDCRQIEVTWLDNSDDETGFHVERGFDGINFLEIAVVGPGITSYRDTAVEENQAYFYRVRAGNPGGYSGYSNTGTASTPVCPGLPPAAPSDLAVSARSGTTISLAWVDNASNEDGFRLYRRTPKSAFVLIAAVAPNVVACADNSVKSKTTYFYKICAFNAYGESCSRDVSARVK
jgi:C1A family cysteine protease